MRKWKQLTETDVLRICAIIDGWPLPTITWEALIQEATIQLGQEYSRQALDRKPLIKQRFQVRKDAKPALMRMDEAEQTIQRQISRIEGLEEIVRQYDLRFMRHVANALRWGKVPEDLDQPIPDEAL